MNKKKMAFGIWLMAMTLMSLFAFVVYFVAKMRYSVLFSGYLILMGTQLFSLTVYLIGEEKFKKKIVRILYKLCCVASLAVIPGFIFIFMALTSQYHATIKEAIKVKVSDYSTILPKEGTTIYETDDLYIFFPEYSSVDFVCENRPSKSDESITWCSGAAFQHDLTFKYSDVNVEGFHACSGTYYDSPYIHEECAAFVFYDGSFKFEFDDPEGAMKEAAKNGGSGFMQYGIIRDGEVTYRFSRTRCYRTLAELNGNLCIIDSKEMINFEDFLDKLQEIHVTNALYMDMGAGWNYSWYRRNDGDTKTLFNLPVPWSFNWVVFRK